MAEQMRRTYYYPLDGDTSYMTTPQNELYNLSYNVKQLVRMFESEKDDDTGEVENSIFDNVKQLYIGHEVLVKRMEKIEDQLALIIKLLGRNE
jgi:hypothetical protein